MGDVPWQIWAVVVVLIVIAVAELLGITWPGGLVAFAIKCVFVVGLIRGWRLVFVLSVVMLTVSALTSIGSPAFVPFLYFALMVLVASAHRYFFPRIPSTVPAHGTP
jgi:hypothetical protein